MKKKSSMRMIRVHNPFMIIESCITYSVNRTLISRRPLSDAEERLHEAAENGKCDKIRALAADGTYMSCPDPDHVRM